jgi:hypothetical protein
MMLAKRCPKCRGDLVLERDAGAFGSSLRCLQCGKTLTREEVLALAGIETPAKVA